MNDEFFTHLAEFGKRLDFVDCVGVDVRSALSVAEDVGRREEAAQPGEGD